MAYMQLQREWMERKSCNSGKSVKLGAPIQKKDSLFSQTFAEKIQRVTITNHSIQQQHRQQSPTTTHFDSSDSRHNNAIFNLYNKASDTGVDDGGFLRCRDEVICIYCDNVMILQNDLSTLEDDIYAGHVCDHCSSIVFNNAYNQAYAYCDVGSMDSLNTELNDLEMDNITYPLMKPSIRDGNDGTNDGTNNDYTQNTEGSLILDYENSYNTNYNVFSLQPPYSEAQFLDSSDEFHAIMSHHVANRTQSMTVGDEREKENVCTFSNISMSAIDMQTHPLLKEIVERDLFDMSIINALHEKKIHGSRTTSC